MQKHTNKETKIKTRVLIFKNIFQVFRSRISPVNISKDWKNWQMLLPLQLTGSPQRTCLYFLFLPFVLHIPLFLALRTSDSCGLTNIPTTTVHKKVIKIWIYIYFSLFPILTHTWRNTCLTDKGYDLKNISDWLLNYSLKFLL